MLLNKNYNKAYLAGIILITLLPVLSIPPLFHPADWGKSIVFRIIFSVLLFLFITQIISQKNYRGFIVQKLKNIPRWFLTPFLCFAGLVVLSTIFSLEPFFSFWGSPYRGGGSLNLLLYLSFAIFCYLAIEKKDWNKILISTIIGGIAVSLIAIAQQFGLFSENLVKYPFRPPSTMGNTNFLAAYLILLLYLPLGFGLKADTLSKKLFYFGSSTLFLFVIAITLSKAAYIGILLGIFWLLLSVKTQNQKLNKLKWLFTCALFMLVFLLLFSANNLQISSRIYQFSPQLGNSINRFTFDKIFGDVRFSGWKIGINALKNRPLLGYGPENFSIGFDKYYDSSLPNLLSLSGGQWWDRAHNFLLDITTTMGIPALLSYLFFWGFLFIKIRRFPLLQATFISYFSALLFGFDCAPTYIISCLLVGYSLSIVAPSEDQPVVKYEVIPTGKKLAVAGLFIFLLFFAWQCNILPMRVNAEINWANFYLEKDGTCERAENKLKPLLNSHTIIDSYLYQTYGNVLSKCLKDGDGIDRKINIVKQIIGIDEKLAKERPYYTRTWLILGKTTAFLLEKDPGNKDLQDKTNYYFTKAAELSPGRPNIFSEWAIGLLSSWNCQKAVKMSDKCLSLNSDFRDCWWVSALSNICLENLQLGEEQMKTALEKGYDTTGGDATKQLIKIYARLIGKTEKNKIPYYEKLSQAYYKLTQIYPQNFQYHASLSYVYKILGKYESAAHHALVVAKLSPESKQSIEEFLRTLPIWVWNQYRRELQQQ